MTTMTATSELKKVSMQEQAAVTSKEGFMVLGEELQRQVEDAVKVLPSRYEQAQAPAKASIVQERAESDERSRGMGDPGYIGEVVLKAGTDPVDLYRICMDLRERVKADVLSIAHSKEGTTIRCTMKDPVTLLSSLGMFGKVAAWSVAAQ
jgi:hypothetical protein